MSDVSKVAAGEMKISGDGTVSQCDTGAVRSTDGFTARYDLISPIGLKALAMAYGEGVPKYGAHNWELGFSASDMLRHVIAHIYNFLGGDRSEDHLGHAAWGIINSIHSVEKWPHLNGDLRGPNCELTDAMRAKIKEFNDARVAAAR